MVAAFLSLAITSPLALPLMLKLGFLQWHSLFLLGHVVAMLHKEGANYSVVLSVCPVHLLASPDRRDCLLFISQ